MGSVTVGLVIIAPGGSTLSNSIPTRSFHTLPVKRNGGRETEPNYPRWIVVSNHAGEEDGKEAAHRVPLQWDGRHLPVLVGPSTVLAAVVAREKASTGGQDTHG